MHANKCGNLLGIYAYNIAQPEFNLGCAFWTLSPTLKPRMLVPNLISRRSGHVGVGFGLD